jgi:hypothetical protein
LVSLCSGKPKSLHEVKALMVVVKRIDLQLLLNVQRVTCSASLPELFAHVSVDEKTLRIRVLTEDDRDGILRLDGKRLLSINGHRIDRIEDLGRVMSESDGGMGCIFEIV